MATDDKSFLNLSPDDQKEINKRHKESVKKIKAAAEKAEAAANAKYRSGIKKGVAGGALAGLGAYGASRKLRRKK